MVVPAEARTFGQEENTFKGMQIFNGPLMFNAGGDSLQITSVSNDTTFASPDSAALVTQYAIDKYLKSYAWETDDILSIAVRQSETNDPIVTVLKNTFDWTIGNISRTGIGTYRISISSSVISETSNLFISNPNPLFYPDGSSVPGFVSAMLGIGAMPSPGIYIRTYDAIQDTLCDGVMSSSAGVVMTIKDPKIGS